MLPGLSLSKANQMSIPGTGSVPKKPDNVVPEGGASKPQGGGQMALPNVAQHEKKQQDRAAKPGTQLSLPGVKGEHGEGSRGGKIVGHTKDGKPIYESQLKEGQGRPEGEQKDEGAGGADGQAGQAEGGKPEGAKPPQKPKIDKAGPNILGAYHFGQALGMAASTQAGGAAITRMLAGRAVSGVHGFLNRKTPADYEAARGQREAQLQRQQELRRMYGEGGGVVVQSSLARSISIKPGMRRLNNGS